ncbi:hypothetical protein [Actibacterium sp. 188UL27-1]|uniref:hypothetical protein n=1 Tax=Actibacterium sp. 188UL27-1 TaxID=2786961 RepID=UPI001957D530|nr:hypothetical protein [Actibacterium sp. 188UL27-1]MBM7066540.1 hypothetical protein [Actibacterium sp. 188UL27-1]
MSRLCVTTDQISTAQTGMLSRFDERMARHLWPFYGAPRSITGPAFTEFVTQFRQAAQARGFRHERHLLDLVEAYMLNGWALELQPKFEQIVAAPMLTAEEKARRIRQIFVSAHPDYQPEARSA